MTKEYSPDALNMEKVVRRAALKASIDELIQHRQPEPVMFEVVRDLLCRYESAFNVRCWSNLGKSPTYAIVDEIDPSDRNREEF